MITEGSDVRNNPIKKAGDINISKRRHMDPPFRRSQIKRTSPSRTEWNKMHQAWIISELKLLDILAAYEQAVRRTPEIWQQLILHTRLN